MKIKFCFQFIIKFLVLDFDPVFSLLEIKFTKVID